MGVGVGVGVCVCVCVCGGGLYLAEKANYVVDIAPLSAQIALLIRYQCAYHLNQGCKDVISFPRLQEKYTVRPRLSKQPGAH